MATPDEWIRSRDGRQGARSRVADPDATLLLLLSSRRTFSEGDPIRREGEASPGRAE